ncbi:MAG: hypothetical protein K2Y27_32860 [Xanthobacteraceae bacterium]|nr:hypothetical protein [Xanthobacteraceae bacterium]
MNAPASNQDGGADATQAASSETVFAPRADNPNIAENQAFVLSDAAIRRDYEKAYVVTSALYYRGKPTFAEILAELATWAKRL